MPSLLLLQNNHLVKIIGWKTGLSFEDCLQGLEGRIWWVVV